MSTNAPTLTREQWRTVLDDTDRPTFGELVSTIEAATMIDAEGPAAEQLVDGAIGARPFLSVGVGEGSLLSQLWIMKCMRRSACMRLFAITAAARRSPGSVSNRLV